MKKAIIFDASTLITLAMNGFFEEIRELKKIFNGKFLITKEVKHEIIDKPLTIKQFELEALQLKQLLDDGVLEMPSSLNINEKNISSKTQELINIANNIFMGNGKDIHLVDFGETSCLILGKILNEKKIENIIAVDERTTRLLCEKPERLKKIMESKLHTRLKVNEENLRFFKGFKIIRSSELIYVAYKKDFINIKDGAIVLDALLWAVKFKGCSISSDEIDEIKRLR